MTHKPKRIQLSRKKGWRKPEGAVVVSRPSGFGNPFKIDEHRTAAECVELYTRLFQGYASLGVGISPADQWKYRNYVIDRLSEIRGKDLCCWCPLDQPCHADVLLQIANGGG